MIVWIASYPRSGNTFFRILLKHVYGLKTFSVHNDPLLGKLGLAEVVGHEALPASIPEMRAAPESYFIKTHELPQDKDPAIYIIRDGRDALVSHANFLLSFQKKQTWLKRALRVVGYNHFEKVLRGLIAKKPHYGGWSEHALSWADRPEAQTVVVRYEELCDSPQPKVEEALSQLGLKPRASMGGQVPDFEELRAKSPDFFRKGKVGQWREEMSPSLQELFLRVHGPVMKRFDYV
jgi:Sulfotransferase domain